MHPAKRKASRFPGLDAELGPATPLTADAARWLVDQAVSRALDPKAAVPRHRGAFRTFSVTAIVLAASAAAATLTRQTYLPVAPTASIYVVAAQKEWARRAKRSAQTMAPADLAALAPEPPTSPASTGTAASAVSVHDALGAHNPVQDLLAKANDLRRARLWQAAQAAYLDVAKQFPQSQQAYVAVLAAAALRLEHLGDAPGALQLYQSLPRDHALGVEALAGIARCDRALGDQPAEVATLQSIVNAYPTSLQSDLARKRLQEIASPPAQ